MAGIDLGKQVGPLPIGAWVAVVGVGLGIAVYARNQGVGNSEPSVVDPGVGVGGSGGFSAVTPSGGGGGVAPGPTTNEEWATMAINGLIALGYPPTAADGAIRRYISGSKLGASDSALIAVALGKYGAPPSPLPPVENEGSDPDPTPTKDPFEPGTYNPNEPHTTGPLAQGVTLKSLAKLYWGDEALWTRLYYANLALINGRGGPTGNLAGLNLYVPIVG